MTKPKTGYVSPIPIHPSLTIKDELKYFNMSFETLAVRTGIKREILRGVFEEKAPITLGIALRLQRVLGLSVEGLFNMQKRYNEDIKNL